MRFERKHVLIAAAALVAGIVFREKLFDLGLINYEVVGLSPGALHVKDSLLGLPDTLSDQQWINKALRGEIKAGSIISAK